MPTLTSNYSLEKPLVNSPVDEDLWGGELNDDLDSIDTLLRAGITIATQSSQTANFSAVATISDKNLYPVDATAGVITATIPAAASAGNGATVFIKKTDASANAVTLARTGADTLDGATSLSLSTRYDCYGLVSDGTSAWSTIAKPSTPVVDATTSVKGIVQLATAAEVLTGTDTSKVATPDALAGSKSLSGSGYYKFPGGFIVQWGSQSVVGTTAVTFPTSFATACYGVQATPTSEVNIYIGTPSTTGVNISNGGSSTTVYWQAVGK